MMLDLASHDDIVGFFSYSRDDDEDSEDALSRLRMRIQNELRAQMGRSRAKLRLWQDREAISAGTLWEGEIDHAVQSSLFFIPIVTPRVVRSKYCRVEFQKFLAREQELVRNDLIFPILYIGVSELENERAWRADPVLRVIGERQYVDWRAFRHEPDSVALRVAIEKFCKSIVAALERRSFEARAEHRGDDATAATADLRPSSAPRLGGQGSRSAMADFARGVRWTPWFSAVAFLVLGMVSGAIGFLTLDWISIEIYTIRPFQVIAMTFSACLIYILYQAEQKLSWRLLAVFFVVDIGWILAIHSAAHLSLYFNNAHIFADYAVMDKGKFVDFTWPQLAVGGAVGGLIGGVSVIAALLSVAKRLVDRRLAASCAAFATVAGLILFSTNLLILFAVWQGGLSAIIAYRLKLEPPARQ